MSICNFENANGPVPKTCPEQQGYLGRLVRTAAELDQLRSGTGDHEPDTYELDALWDPCSVQPASIVVWYNTTTLEYHQWFTIAGNRGGGTSSWVRMGTPVTPTYAYYVRLLGSNPMLLWRMNEAAGGTAFDSSPYSDTYDGAYNNCTLAGDTGPDGENAPTFNGTSSYVEGNASGILADFPTATGAMLAWAKVSGSSDWTDGVARIIAYATADANNYVRIRESTVNGTLDFEYKAGGASKLRSQAGLSTTNWMCVAVKWDKPGANEFKAFYNGVQVGTTAGTLGTWAGAVVNMRMGSLPAGTNWWRTSLALGAIWDYNVPDATLIALMTV